MNWNKSLAVGVMALITLTSVTKSVAQEIDALWLKQAVPCTWDVATGPDGSIYCVQPFPGTVVKFDSNGSQLLVWGSDGGDAGEFAGPRGVAVDSLGYVYVADESNHRIQQFGRNGTFLKMWGSDVLSGIGSEGVLEVCAAGNTCYPGIQSPAGFTWPHDVAVDPRDDTLIVADTVANRVVRLDPATNELTPLFEACCGQVLSVSMDDNGSVYITMLPNWVAKYELTNGQYAQAWSYDLGYFFPPTAHYVALDSLGNAYVSNEYNHRIHKFDSTGAQIMVWGWGVATGEAVFEVCTSAMACLDGIPWQDGDAVNPGQFNGPIGITVDPQNSIIVIDGSGRLQKFGHFEPEEKIVDLIADIIALNLQKGLSSSLDSKLSAAFDALTDLNENNDASVINRLNAIINEVEAQRGKKISEADADYLVNAVQAIIDLL